jgi:hypothetical protein
MKIFKQIDLCFIFQPQKYEVQSCFLNQQKLKTMKFKHLIEHFIYQNFHTIFKICQVYLSVLSWKIKQLEQEWRSFINFCSQKSKELYQIHYSCRAIENPTTNRRNMSLFEFLHPKVFNCGKNSFVERTKPLRNFSKRSGTGCTNKS